MSGRGSRRLAVGIGLGAGALLWVSALLAAQTRGTQPGDPLAGVTPR